MAARRPVQRAPPERRPRPSEPAPDSGSARSCPPTGPRTVPRWRTSPGPPSAATPSTASSAADPARRPPGARVAPSKPPPSPIRLTARGDLVSGDRLRLTDAKDTARAHLRDHHVPISTHEFIVRRRPRERPATAPATRASANGEGSVQRLGTWRGAHFAAPARDPTTGLPTAATSLEDAADASRRRYGVAADIRERAGSACQETSRARGPPDASAPASARSTFRRKEAPKYTDAASFHAAQRATARATGRWDASPAIRPASARPATATTRLVAGEGRGGGGLPTAAPGSATARARRVARPRGRGRISAGGRRRSSRDR